MDVISHSILPFLAMLLVLMVVHELGHFVTCKLAGVTVLEFGLGLPPRIAGIKWGETEYTLNAIPFGAFVRPLGEEDPTDPRGLGAKPRWVRLIILGAGAGMNVVLAVFLFSLAVMIPRTVDVGRAQISDVIPGSPADEAGLQSGDIIYEVDGRDVKNLQEVGYMIRLNLGEELDFKVRRGAASPGSTSSGAGFVEVPVRARWSTDAYTYSSAIGPGSSIAATADVPIDLRLTSTRGFGENGVLTLSPGTPNEEQFEYYLESAGTVTLTKRAVGDTTPHEHGPGAAIEHKVSQGPTGITISTAYATNQAIPEDERAEIAEKLPAGVEAPTTRRVPFTETQWDPPWVAIPDGAQRAYESIILARNEIISKIQGGVGGGGGFQVTGPVGIAQLTGEVVEEAGWKSLMEFAALISMNLAVLNILPLPMLDGGRVVFVLLEYVRGGRRIAPQKEAMVHFVGLVVMLLLAVVITYFDVLRIFEGEGILR